jgi:hypothetical protein
LRRFFPRFFREKARKPPVSVVQVSRRATVWLLVKLRQIQPATLLFFDQLHAGLQLLQTSGKLRQQRLFRSGWPKPWYVRVAELTVQGRKQEQRIFAAVGQRDATFPFAK